MRTAPVVVILINKGEDEGKPRMPKRRDGALRWLGAVDGAINAVLAILTLDL